ncbi:MAG: T9SS type A sorting domain-containing protein [Bacteroidales bacterium]|nr:T9SS type A sorting domain-containing protein [Bacteroidales bacterium]
MRTSTSRKSLARLLHFVFGTNVEYWSARSGAGGNVKVYIDGKFIAKINCNGNSNGQSVALYKSDTLALGWHDIMIEVVNGWVYVDGMKFYTVGHETVNEALNWPVIGSNQDVMLLPYKHSPGIKLLALANDPDGEIISKQWQQIAGSDTLPIVNTASDSLVLPALQTGVYTFNFTVTDNDSLTTTKTFWVARQAPTAYHKPQIKVSNNIQYHKKDTTISISGTITDNDGEIVSHYWIQKMGPPVNIGDSTLASLEFTNLPVGYYVFWLYAFDNDGLSSNKYVTIEVLEPTVADVFRLQKVMIFPNPVQKELHLSLPDMVYATPVKIEIYNTNGAKVFANKFSGSNQLTIPVQNMPPGLYIVTSNINNKNYINKFVIGN